MADKKLNGIPVNDKTVAEMKMIGEEIGLKFEDYFKI